MERIVVSQPGPDIQDSSPSVEWSQDPQAKYQDQQHHAENLVAGVLSTRIRDSRPLADILKAEGEKPTIGYLEK